MKIGILYSRIRMDEKMILDRVLVELQMNYVDEIQRKDEKPQEEESKEAVAEDISGKNKSEAAASDSKPAEE